MNQENLSPEQQEKIIVGALDNNCINSFSPGTIKYISGARVPLFGHAKHSAFTCTSTDFIDVPDTYSAAYSPNGTGIFRLEVTFATKHDKAIALRMFDPANPTYPPTWEFTFTGGHAPNSWWNFQITDSFQPSTDDPWPRQQTLQMKSVDGSEAILGSVVIVVEKFTPR
jgi:hypothetical protein